MAAFVKEKVFVPGTTTQARDEQNALVWVSMTDPKVHKTKVTAELYDELNRSFISSGRKKSEPVTDVATGKVYIMREGNAPKTDPYARPEKGQYVGVMIDEVTQDQAKVERSDKTPMLTEVMERIAELEKGAIEKDAKIAELEGKKKGKKAPKEDKEEAVVAPVVTDVPEGDDRMVEFVGAHWKTQQKMILDGKMKGCEAQILAGNFTAKVKEAVTKVVPNG